MILKAFHLKKHHKDNNHKEEDPQSTQHADTSMSITTKRFNRAKIALNKIPKSLNSPSLGGIA